jgi:predicted nucleotidyltransferase
MSWNNELVRAQLRVFFRDKPVLKAELFGCCSGDHPDVDVELDLLITLVPSAEREEVFRMEEDLSALFGRRVSILLRPLVEIMDYQPARELILNSAVLVYDAAAGAQAVRPPAPRRHPKRMAGKSSS